MFSEANVLAVPLTFGTAYGTGTVGAGTSALGTGLTGTGTSAPWVPPRNDFTGAVTVYSTLVTTTASTTATATGVATCVWQASNDKQAWFAIASASASSTLATTATGTVLSLTGAASAGVNFISQRYGYLRAVVTVTGTGAASASVPMGF